MLFYFSYIECQHFVILLSFFSHSAFTFLSEEWRKNALLSAFCIDRLESEQFSFFFFLRKDTTYDIIFCLLFFSTVWLQSSMDTKMLNSD